MATTGTRADVLLADGTVASIRSMTESDHTALDALHERVGADNLRLRFFSPSRAAGPAYVRHLLSTPATIALVVEHGGVVVALGTAEMLSPTTAEVAFLVDDACHGLGIGSLLLEHLAAAGRDRGVQRFVAEVLTDNSSMLAVLRDAGFAQTRHTEAGTVHVELDTTATAEAVRAADERECRSEARSLGPVLSPKSVAVVGVRRDGTGVGAAVLRSVRAGGYGGALHVVHPTEREVAGVPAVRRLRDLPGRVDLVVVAVPAPAVLEVLRDAAAARCRGAVVLSSGFAETGADGGARQREALDLARSSSMRLVGPNCLGLLNNDPAVRLDATFSGTTPPPGGLALASQSGGVGIVLADLARRAGLGVGQLVSLGNKVDVSGNDLLAAWRDDPRVTAAGLYLESFGNAPKFARLAREFSERKPLLAVVGGRSAGGRRAGASHTAAAATSSVGTAAVFAQAGVIACATAEDLADCALVLQQQPLPVGRRVAILSNAGGVGVLAADAAEALGLVVPELPDRLRADLAACAPTAAGTSNPVDAGAAAAPAEIAGLAERLLVTDEVDALVVVLVATAAADATGAVEPLRCVRRAHPERPVLLVALGGLEVTGGDGLTTYPSATVALQALARAASYAEWRREPHASEPPGDPGRRHRARTALDDLLTRRPDGGWLGPDEIAEVVAGYGLVPEGERVRGRAAASAAAERLGLPVAVKTADWSVVHRTERGLVRTGLSTRAAVRRAVAELEQSGTGTADVLVQPMVAGVEVAIGLVQDPCFGPLVMVGAGGVATEVWADRTFLVPPVTARDAARAIRSLRIWPLLDGFRGGPPGDVAGLVGLLVRVSTLADELPAVAELDLNPVIVAPDACHLVDVKVRIDPGPVPDAGVPRRLRRPS